MQQAAEIHKMPSAPSKTDIKTQQTTYLYSVYYLEIVCSRKYKERRFRRDVMMLQGPKREVFVSSLSRVKSRVESCRGSQKNPLLKELGGH